jgi:hypothetical protein
MAKKNKCKAEERTVIVDKGDSSYLNAVSEVKKISGFDCAIPIKARLVGNAIEYEFLVSDTMLSCEQELLNLRIESELSNR